MLQASIQRLPSATHTLILCSMHYTSFKDASEGTSHNDLAHTCKLRLWRANLLSALFTVRECYARRFRGLMQCIERHISFCAEVILAAFQSPKPPLYSCLRSWR